MRQIGQPLSQAPFALRPDGIMEVAESTRQALFWFVRGLIIAESAFVYGPTAYASSAGTYPLIIETNIPAPVKPACVSSPFGPRILANRPLAGTFHNGIDLSAPIGSPVTAVAPGTVIRIQRRGVGGLEILIQHDGFIGVYSHLGLIAPPLAEGRKTVSSGERIATVGRSGLTYGPHVYFGMIIGGRSVDPAPHLMVAPCGPDIPAAKEIRSRPAGLVIQH